MSDTQTIWQILWNRAARSRNESEPFEIDEVAPEIAKSLDVSVPEAKRAVSGLMKELARLPEGEQFFTLEGNAVVPLAEFEASRNDPKAACQAYPFEL